MRFIRAVNHRENRVAYAGERPRRILVQQPLVAGAVQCDQQGMEDPDVGRREVETLDPGGPYDVGGIAHQEQAPEAHPLRDEAAQRRDALLDRRAGLHPVGLRLRQAAPQLALETGVGQSRWPSRSCAREGTT